LKQSTNKDLSNFVSGDTMASLVSFCLRYCMLPAKLIAYFFIQNRFKCDYNHYSTVAFGNTRLTLWPKNVLRL